MMQSVMRTTGGNGHPVVHRLTMQHQTRDFSQAEENVRRKCRRCNFQISLGTRPSKPLPTLGTQSELLLLDAYSIARTNAYSIEIRDASQKALSIGSAEDGRGGAAVLIPWRVVGTGSAHAKSWAFIR
jgi:hypothetical protein